MLVVGVACSLAAAARPGEVFADEGKGPWNVVWIIADDMSPDTGAYSDTYARTPTLDRLAAEGMRFDRAFANAPVCAPSRSTLYTGVHATTLGSHHMRSWAIPPPWVRPFPELLRRAGYYTANNSKIDWNFNPHLDENVMRAVFEPPLGVWDDSSRTAHWRNRPPGKPFFAVFDLFVTHESRIRFPDAQFEGLVAEVPASQRHDPQAAVLPAYYPDDPAVRRDWARYYDLVTAADVQVATILAELAEDGLSDSTIVVFTGDHGRGLPRAKRWLYDSGLRVPLIVRWPGVIEGGSVTEELVSFVDFAPTFLSLLGIPVPEHMQGRIFLGPAKQPEPQFVFAYRDRMDETYDNMRAVRSRRLAYIRNFEPMKPYAQPIAYMDEMPTMKAWRRLAVQGRLEGAPALFFRDHKPEEELYDVAADPDEVRDLAADPAFQEELVRLRRALDQWQRESGDLGMQSEEELVAAMRPPGRDVTTIAPEATPPPGVYGERFEVTLSSPTEGAVIAFTTGEGEDAVWRLYEEPIPITSTVTLRAKAGRLGFFDSEERRLRYEIGH